jgi:endonuclease/exonuclease/phosphatase family metal-dependent hydrolase
VWEKCNARHVVLAGDFNVYLVKSGHGAVKAKLVSFITDLSLRSAYELYPGTTFASYDNLAFGQASLLDYFLVMDPTLVADVFIVEPAIAYSDHLPVFCALNFALQCNMPPV